MKVLNRKQTINHLQEMHMRFKALKAIRNFIKKPKLKVVENFKGDIARLCIETWAKS